jgi:hypothetical protein
VVTALVDGVATEIVRHRRSTPGNPVVLDELYPSAPWAPQLWRDGWPTPISDRHDQIRSRPGTARHGRGCDPEVFLAPSRVFCFIGNR